MIVAHKSGCRPPTVPDRSNETRWIRYMVHTLEGLCTHSEFIVHAHRVETIKSTYHVVCKVIMCPDPYFWYHSINDYEYNNLKKSDAVLAWKKRILK